MASQFWGITIGTDADGDPYGSIDYGDPAPRGPIPASWIPWILWGALAYFIAIAREK